MAGHPVGVSRGGAGHSIVEGSAYRRGERAIQMTVRPARLNAAIAWLFMVGSACFVVGSVPAYLNAVGCLGRRHHLRRRVALLHHRLVLPARAGAEPRDDRRRPGAPSTARARAAAGLAAARPQLARRGHPVPRHALLQHQHRRRADPQRDGRRVQPVRLAAGPLRVDALPRVERVWPCSPSRTGSSASSHGPFPWRIAWLNMLGSVLFMASALGQLRAPEHRRAGDARVSPSPGTLLGAVCFLVGAALMFPAWRRALEPAPAAPRGLTP